MDDDDVLRRRRRGEVLNMLLAEDVSALGIEELEERITALEGEIARVRAQIDQKRGSLSVAEALFKK